MSRASRQRFRRSARRVIKRQGQAVTLVRQSAGRRVKGIPTPGDPTTESVLATVLPLSASTVSGGDMRDVLPDGARLDQGRLFLIHVLPGRELAAIRTAAQAGGPAGADIVRYGGVDYKVYNVHNFAEHGHIEVIALGPDRARA